METSILFPSDPDMITEKDILQLHPYSTYNSETSRRREVWAIVALNKESVIGSKGSLPWRLSEDLHRFKTLTMGHPVIMGRKTWESLPKRPLPGRRNMVISRNTAYDAQGAEVFSSVEEALNACREIPFIIGGEQIYHSALPFCTRIYQTVVNVGVEGADAFFPVLNMNEWRVEYRGDEMVSKGGIHYYFQTLFRRQ